jgi:hypothetical protein
MWTLDYLIDLRADFRVFYRIREVESLPAPEFFALAARAPFYPGVMAARVRALAVGGAERERPLADAPELAAVDGFPAVFEVEKVVIP